MQTYKTRDGDVIDEVLWRHYGRQDAAMLRAVIAANPSLPDVGAILPAGVTVILPDIDAPATIVKGVSLWD